MKLNQYAVYRVDQTSSGKALWRLPYDMVQKKKLQIRIEFYRQQRIEKVSADDTAMTIWNRRKDSFEVSDVLVLNKEGELTTYYISEDYLTPIEGFIRMNSSGALISMDTVDYHLENRKGSWMATDYIIIDGKQFFLLEHTEYRDKVPAVVLDAYGKIMADNVRNGFDDAVKQQIRNQIRPQEQTKLIPQKQQLQRLEIWQKYYQNGEWLRQAESGGEANYDMVDGRVNNLPKQPEKTKAKKRKKKESVIGKLHKKQIEIAIRSGKPIPKYLEQNRELNRR
ncbi:DUF4316 domain-containing protein [bacterium]|nr:DUF4316 domain-containing protein [bacterium]MDY2884090.1 DUF4316 domain-containing protein [Bariatricus sp.]